jgi:tetratricopeptide (TPR) repeat protein
MSLKFLIIPRTMFPAAGVLALAVLGTAPEGLANSGHRGAVSLVVSADNATVMRAGRSTPDIAVPGLAIYERDAIVSKGGALKIADCVTSTLLQFNGSVTLNFSDKGPTPGPAAPISGRTHLDFCRIPELDPSYDATDFAGAAPKDAIDLSPERDLEGAGSASAKATSDMLSRIATRLRIEPDDPLTQITRAVILEESGQASRALALYRYIRDKWPGTAWLQQPIHRLSVANDIQPADAADNETSNSAQPVRKTFALLIGISHYQNQNWVHDLDYADQDAILFQQFLMSPRGGGLVPDENLTILLNEDATQENIRSHLTTLAHGKGSGQNTLIIFIAAHGRYVCVDKGGSPKINRDCQVGAATEMPYLLTYDSSPEEPKTLGFAMSEIRSLIIEHALRFGRVLVYVDVCHAGNIGRLELPTSSALQEQLSGNGTGLLMATTVRSPKDREHEFAYESPSYGHGVFTYTVVRELNGSDPLLVPRNDDNYVHFQELVGRVINDVPPATNYRQFPMAATPIPQELPVVEHPDRPGIVPWTDVGVKSSNAMLRRRGHADQSRTGRQPPMQSRPLSGAEQAQQVIRTYVQGDQVPQIQADFERAAALFRQEWEISHDKAFTESRMIFCEARALLFRQPGQELQHHALDQARSLLQRSILLDPNRAYAYNALGIAWLETQEVDPLRAAQNLDRAIAAFDDANRFAPYWAYPLHNAALALEQKGAYDEAIKMYREAMRVAPQASYPAYNLALLLQKLNRIDEARQEFKYAIDVGSEARRQNPGAPFQWSRISDGYSAWATLESAEGRWREAGRLLKEALKADPANPIALHNDALLDAGPRHKPGRAITTWRKLLETEPTNTAYRTSLARTLVNTGRKKEAVAEYESLVASHPGTVAAWRELSLLYVSVDALAEAERTIQRGLAADISNSDLNRDLSEISAIRAGHKPAMTEYRAAQAKSRVAGGLK